MFETDFKLNRAQREFLDSRIDRASQVFDLQQDWAIKLMCDKEKAEVIDLLRASGSFSTWLDTFGRDKLSSDILEMLEDEQLQEIYEYVVNRLPLPFRLQRILNFCYNLSYADQFKGYVEKYADAREAISAIKTLAEDVELHSYMTKALKPLEHLLQTLERDKKWSGGQLAYAMNLIERLWNRRTPIVGFFLHALDRAGLSNPNMATSAPWHHESFPDQLNTFKEHGLDEKRISLILDDGDRRTSYITAFKNLLLETIVDGRLPAKKERHIAVVENPDVLDVQLASPIEVTKEGLERWENELNTLKMVKRREVAKRLKEAMELGDLSENSEYDDARNEQVFVERRIQQLESLLRRAVVVDKPSTSDGKIRLGSNIVLLDLKPRTKLALTVVGEAEGGREGTISIASPLGRELLGKRKGQLVGVHVTEVRDSKPAVFKILSVD